MGSLRDRLLGRRAATAVVEKPEFVPQYYRLADLSAEERAHPEVERALRAGVIGFRVYREDEAPRRFVGEPESPIYAIFDSFESSRQAYGPEGLPLPVLEQAIRDGYASEYHRLHARDRIASEFKVTTERASALKISLSNLDEQLASSTAPVESSGHELSP